MNGVLVDSDIIIEVLRQRNLEVVRRWIGLAESEEPLFFTPISLAEIRHGMRDAEGESIETVFSVMRCVAIGVEIGRRAGDYLRRFHASHGVEIADAIIAAAASLNSLALWTRNRKHYPMRDVDFFVSPV